MKEEKREKPEYCDACGFETTEIKEYRLHRNVPDEDYAWFCELCVSTYSATAYEYPLNFPGREADILLTICYVGNLILQEIRKPLTPESK